jgi:membrane protein required for colicin V production
MTGFDILVLVIVAVSALLAFARGFVREVLSMMALVLGVLAAIWALPVFRDPVRGMIQPGWMADTILVVVIFLLIYVAVRVMTGFLHEWVHDSEPLGVLDRTAGLLFGVARGFVVLGVAVLLVTSVARTDMLPKFLTEAKFYPLLVLTGDSLRHLAPGAGEAVSDMARGAAEAGADLAVDGAVDGAINELLPGAGAGQGERPGWAGEPEPMDPPKDMPPALKVEPQQDR